MYDDDHPTLEKATHCPQMFKQDSSVDKVLCDACALDHCSSLTELRTHCEYGCDFWL